MTRIHCYAPLLSDRLLERYDALSDQIEDTDARHGYDDLLLLVASHKALPTEPKGEPLTGGQHSALMGLIPTLAKCDQLAEHFQNLPDHLRNPAWHLLWYARELSIGRNPLTKDE